MMVQTYGAQVPVAARPPVGAWLIGLTAVAGVAWLAHALLHWSWAASILASVGLLVALLASALRSMT